MLTTPYIPQSNITERVIRSLLQIMRALLKNKPKNWAPMVPYAVRAYNMSLHHSLGDTPYFFFHGRDPLKGIESCNAPPNKAELAIGAQYGAKLAREHLKATQGKRQNKNIGKNMVKYDVGDIVYLRLVTISDKLDKLKYRFQGPYRIIDLYKNVATLKYMKDGKIRGASLRKVRLYLSGSMSYAQNPNVGNPIPDQDEELPENLDLLGSEDNEPNVEDSDEEVEAPSGYFTRSKAK